MPSKPESNNNWAETLARFLSEHPGVEAVRIDATSRKVSVATLGEVNFDQLQAQLAATITAVENQLGQATKIPTGFTLRREGDLTEMAGVSCATAPTFWRWREFAWPDLVSETHEVEAPEW